MAATIAKSPPTRRELLDRWRSLEDDLDEPHLHPLKHRTLLHLKQLWFSDAFNFLINAPAGDDVHLWCGCWDLMAPLLETFHAFRSDAADPNAAVGLLWKRASREMRRCTQCICQYRQAQETYRAEYDHETVEPLLRVLMELDTERVTAHLRHVNAVISGKEYDADLHGPDVVSLVFEILTFPVLLEDQVLSTEFESFLEAIDSSHELSLAGDQQYPGVYALLFMRSAKARAIGLRLAGSMGKLRSAADLEPLQPLLSKYIGILETEVLPSISDTSRPRVQLERMTIWLGLKALLAFLEAAAFEEGILERYPIFLSIVLNHVSDDTPEFSCAVTCLRLFFQMLGCKLWLRTTLSPSMMRNTLLGQCFHTRNEKSHKEIFDLFLPFLQSLEALQDGEYEKQRRHLLYFLFHQVTKSSNFSFLMRKNACKIALLIIQRGYTMNPPCPPFECSHMWGPSLVSSLKDSSLHSALRKPAFDLVEAITVSDCAALVSLKLRSYACAGKDLSSDLFTDEDETSFLYDDKEGELNCWSAFSCQSKLAARECGDWRCIPMLWVDIFVELDPSLLSISCLKAVLWALSHVSIVESDYGIDMKLPIREWLASNIGELSSSLGWEVPKGYDDGEDGKESKNSVKASLVCFPLIKAFKRCTAHLITLMEQRELHKQWTWESRMAESLILLLVDPNDSLRQINRLILEHVSKTRGLTPGLLFLCCSRGSLSAVYTGFKYAIKQAQLEPNLKSFPSLHHLLFVARKLLKEVTPSSVNLRTESETSTSLSGGFLRLPRSIHSQVAALETPSVEVDVEFWNKFCCVLSESIWPFLLKCLKEGINHIHEKGSQMTCVRLLETLPIIFERIVSSGSPLTLNSEISASVYSDFNWIFDLAEWGRSSLTVVLRHWKQHIASIVNLFQGFHGIPRMHAIADVQKLISCDVVPVDELKKQLSQYLSSLSKEDICNKDNKNLKPKALNSHFLLFDEKKIPASELFVSSRENNVVDIVDSIVPATVLVNTKNDVVIISDDEGEKCPSPNPLSNQLTSRSTEALKEVSGGEVYCLVNAQTQDQPSDSNVLRKTDLGPLHQDVKNKNAVPLRKSAAGRSEAAVKSKGEGENKVKVSTHDERKRLTDIKEDQLHEKMQSVEEMVIDPANDPLEEALNFTVFAKVMLTKPSISVPKRKLIQLQMPSGERSGYLNRMRAQKRRHKPPKLDNWYRPILEFNYFAVAGLSAEDDDFVTLSQLKEVPLCFNSPEHYVEVFRPLVLEEFKAQLHNSYVEASSSDDISCVPLCILSVERIDDFHLVRGSPEKCESLTSRAYSENDLVLLTKDPLQSSSQSLHALAKVERREKSNKSKSVILTLRFYLQGASPRLIKIRRLLIERSKWYISHIMSMTPQLREFQVLSSLNDIPLMDVILNPVNFSASLTESSKIGLGKLAQPMQHSLKSSFNKSQLQAVSVAIGNRVSTNSNELSLIQGPPGTGKTRTIVAIISALLALNSSRNGEGLKTSNRSSRLDSSTCSNVSSTAREASAIARAWQDAALAKQMVQEEDKPSCASRSHNSKGRILVCAQSNAAVDELVARINCGLCGEDGKMYKPFLIRVGNVKTVHPNSLPFFIDTLVQKRLEEHMSEVDAKKTDRGVDSSISLRSKLEKVVENIRLFESMRAKLRDSELETKNSLEEKAPTMVDEKDASDSSLGVKLNRLYAQKRAICADLSAAQTSEKKDFDEIRELKIKIRKSIIREAEIIVTTLSGCGGDIYGVCSDNASDSKITMFSEHSLFDAVLIDEAAQALEPATLIPLQLLKSRGTKCIMVGDPKQLPATVLSNAASKFFYQCSMFERLQRAGYPVTMLNEQYRMHPEICKFPASHFYENMLVNGAEMTRKSAPFHEHAYFGPYIFYDIADGVEQPGRSTGSLSICNEAEAEAAVELLKILKKRYPSEFSAQRIGVVTPYKRQLSVLRFRFGNEFGPEIIANMEFNTVDGFQGREVDILLLSTVRASGPNAREALMNSKSIGFVADARRMNVALTRAKLSLWIFGNARTLQTNSHWSDLIGDAKARNFFVSVLGPYKQNFGKLISSTRKHDRPCKDSSGKHHKLDENIQCGRSCDQQKVKPTTMESGERSGREGHDLHKEQKIEAGVTSPDGLILGGQKSSMCLESNPGSEIISDLQKVKQKKPDNCSSTSYPRKQRTLCADEEIESLDSFHKKEKYPIKKSKVKNVNDSEQASGDTLSRSSRLPRTGGSKQLETDHECTKKVGDLQGRAVDPVTSRKRQRDAVDAVLSSSLISSKKFDASKPAGPMPVKRSSLPSTSTKPAIRPPKKDKFS